MCAGMYVLCMLGFLEMCNAKLYFALIIKTITDASQDALRQEVVSGHS